MNKMQTCPLPDSASAALKWSMALPPTLLILSLVSVRLSAINLTTYIMNELGTPQFFAIAILLLNLSMTISSPVGGKLSDLFGRKRLVLWGLVPFILSVLVCGLTSNIYIFLAAFFTLGFSYGLCSTMHNGMVADVYGGTDRVRFIAYLTSAQSLAQMLAPVIAGMLADLFTPKMALMGIGSLAIAAWLLVCFCYPDIRYRDKKAQIDFAGIGALVLTVAPFTLALTLGGKQLPWTSPVTVGMLLVSVAGLALFISVENRAAEPVIDFGLFRIRSFLPMAMFTAFCLPAQLLALSYTVMYGNQVLGFSAAQTGAFGILQILAIIMAPMVGNWLSRTRDYRKSFGIAGILLLLFGLGMLFVMSPSVSYITILIFMLIQSLAMNFDLTPNTAMMSLILPAEKRGVGMAFMGFSFYIMNTLASAVFGLILNNVPGGIEHSFRYMAMAVTGLCVIRLVVLKFYIHNPEMPGE